MHTSTLPFILATTSASWLNAGGSSANSRDLRGGASSVRAATRPNGAAGVTRKACFGANQADVIKVLRIDRAQVAQAISGRHPLL